MKKAISGVLFLLSVSCYAVPATADSFIHLRSDPGDYIGGGTTRTLTTATGTITASRNIDNGVSIQYNSTSGAVSWWNLDFGGPNKAPLATGNYEGATRFAFHSPTKPGLDVNGDGRGCNTITGRFVVREAIYGPGDVVQSFAVDFEQHCDGAAPALWGAVRFNSSIPLAVQAPNAAAGPDRNVIEGSTVTLDGSKSSDADGTIASYKWRQLSGTTVTLSSPSVAQTTFVAPQVPVGGDNLVFELEVKDNSGLTGTDTAKIHVASITDPQFSISYSSQQGDYIGLGKTWFMSIDDGVFSATVNSSNGVYIRFTGDTSWSLNFSAPGNQPLTKMIYEGALRWPFQGPNLPGLDVSGDGRGCNTLTGQFVVHDVKYGAGSLIDRFYADFEQHCEGAAPALLGTVKYNYREKADLTIAGAGTGVGTAIATGISCAINAGATSGDCVERYNSGSVVTLTAEPASGSMFAGWSGDSDCSDGSVTMDANKACTATFTLAPPASVTLAVNGNSAAEVTLTNPVTVTYQIAGCQNREMYLVLNAPAMNINWSYLNAAGQWTPLPANLANITPFNTAGPADGGYTLYSGTAPIGNYDLYVGCDFVTNGHLDYTGGPAINGVYDYAVVHVN